jgi:phenylalanyl-tRNA synthetase beta chain
VRYTGGVKELAEKLTLAGHMLDKVYKKGGETIIDLELRGNREDLFSIMGIAHEVHALFDVPLIKAGEVNLERLGDVGDSSKVNVKVEAKDLVNRFVWVEIEGLKVGESPGWLKKLLELVEVPSINNVVDATNYVMYLTGQPLHAFDSEKIEDGKLVLRRGRKGEKFLTFDETKVTVVDEDLVAADKKKLLGFLGVIGGKSSGVTDETESILLEGGNYNQPNVRRTSLRHKLRTDAALRLEKNIDPTLPPGAVGQCAEMIVNLAGGKVVGGLQEYSGKVYQDPWKKVLFRESEVERLGGMKVDSNRIGKIFELLKLKADRKEKGVWEIGIPWRRSDIEGEADVVEEILRIVGYDKIPTEPLRGRVVGSITPSNIEKEDKVRDILVHLGLKENVFDSFISKEDQENFFGDLVGTIEVANPTSPETSLLRTSLIPAQVMMAKKLVDEGRSRVGMFELGKVYEKKGGRYIEEGILGGVMLDANRKRQEVISDMTGILKNMLRYLGVVDFKLIPEGEHELMESKMMVRVVQGSRDLVRVGLLKRGVVRRLGLEGDVVVFEMRVEDLLKTKRGLLPVLKYRFPPVIQDMTFVLPERTYVGLVMDEIKGQSKLVARVKLMDTYKKARTFRVWFQHEKKNLTDKQVKPVREKIVEVIEKEFGGKLK